jgi:hypothetical protein
MRTCTHTNANIVENVNTLVKSICMRYSNKFLDDLWSFMEAIIRICWVYKTKIYKSQDGKPKSKTSLLLQTYSQKLFSQSSQKKVIFTNKQHSTPGRQLADIQPTDLPITVAPRRVMFGQSVSTRGWPRNHCWASPAAACSPVCCLHTLP